MNQAEKENLDSLFLYHGNVLGAARTTSMALNSLVNAFDQLECEQDEISERYEELAAAIKASQPRITPLSHMLEQFEEEMKPFWEKEINELKAQAKKILKTKVKLYKSHAERVVRHGIQFVEEGDGIIVHSASSMVTNVLLQAKQVMLKDFSVIVLQLDPVRTPQVALTLEEQEIPHIVIPAFNLCHYVEQANKILLGAVSVTRDLKVVAPVGTSTTLSLCRLNGIKSYLFANSFHFSHGLADAQRIFQTDEKVASSRSTYHLTTHSHDLVDIELIDTLIDQDGIVENERLWAFAG
jgi:translation initiation factor 2B subunit (eIF-2B alpha/beta/delta family)